MHFYKGKSVEVTNIGRLKPKSVSATICQGNPDQILLLEREVRLDALVIPAVAREHSSLSKSKLDRRDVILGMHVKCW